jgi:hypothetical protein
METQDTSEENLRRRKYTNQEKLCLLRKVRSAGMQGPQNPAEPIPQMDEERRCDYEQFTDGVLHMSRISLHIGANR